jgi:integrase
VAANDPGKPLVLLPRAPKALPKEDHVGFIEKRSGGYRARHRDPLRRLTSKTFHRKADAERWVREMEVNLQRGEWLYLRSGQVPLPQWAEDFLSLARRLSPTTQVTYRRDLSRYILPRFGAAQPHPSRRDRELAQRGGGSRQRPEFGALPPPDAATNAAGGGREAEDPVEPCDRVQPPRVPKREMVFLSWDQAVDLAEAHHERYRGLIYLAVYSGMRWSELVGLRRARLDVRTRKVRVTEQLIRLEAGRWQRKEPKTPAPVRSITISEVTADILADHFERFGGKDPDGLVFPDRAGNPIISSSFWANYFSPALVEQSWRADFTT